MSNSSTSPTDHHDIFIFFGILRGKTPKNIDLTDVCMCYKNLHLKTGDNDSKNSHNLYFNILIFCNS